MTSVKLRNSIPSRTVGPTSYASEKCCNCNQNLVAKIPVDSSRLNTNVAVTINKQNTPFADNLQCVKASVSDDRRTQKAPNCRDNFAPTKGSSKPNTADQSHRTVGSCREQLIRSEPKDPNESLINSTVFVNGRHELAEQRPITSKQDPFRINHALVGLGYDGLDLVENNPSEGDVTKELDMSLFDNDLLDYLPDYLIDMNGLPSEGRESDGLDVVSRTCSLSRDQCCSSVIPKTTSNHITFPSSLSTDIISSSTSSICSDGYRRGHQLHQNMVRNNTVGVNIQRSSSPFTDVISTHCRTFSHLDSSPSDTSYEGLAPTIRHTMTSAVNSRQCPSFTSPQTFACSDVDPAKRITPAITISPLRSQTLTASDTLVHRYNNVNTDCTKPCDTEYQINTPPLPESEGPLTESLDTITEFSPEWSYCEGKTKVLVLGRWTHLDGSYTCLFGGCIVPGTLIQSGVLRCFCPPHEAGLVALQVAWNGFIVSNACVFEYKARDIPVSPVQEWLGISEVELKKLIVEKMERLEATFVVGGDLEAINSVCSLSDSLEDRIVKVCEMLFERAPTNTSTHEEVGSKGLSLLHLAAALGFTKLIKLLRQNTVSQFEQRSGNRTNNGDVMTPVIGWTPLSKDTCGCSPLMWACWRGHTDSALALLAWEPSSYDNCDNTGRSPKLMAEEMGHEDLARKMEEFISCQNNE